MKKLLYILSGNLSTTPRALQSIKTANIRYKVAIICVNRGNNWQRLDKILVDENKLNYKSISLQRKPFFNWLISSFINKLAEIIYPFFNKSIKINAWASSKTMYLLEKELGKTIEEYDLIIAHSYSSLYPAYQFSTKHQIPFIFDIEDYHPGEKCSQDEKRRREFLMKKLLPAAAGITYASPLIGEYSLKLIEKTSQDFPSETGKWVLINNSFSQNEFEYKENKSKKVKFIWFSQNISASRGLELVIPALEKFQDEVEITLIGNLNQNFYSTFLHSYNNFIQIEEPVIQSELHCKIAQFDIGLAVEISTFDVNKDIALSNKIFSYAQAGLYILTTDTKTQKQFISENPNLGILTAQTIPEIEKQIEWIIQNILNIRAEKKNRFEYAKKLAWENESQKLLDLWENTLGAVENPLNGVFVESSS